MNGLQRLQAHLQEQQLNGMIIMSPINLHYFAGFTGTTAFAFVTENTAHIITDFRYTEQATQQCEGYTVIQYETNVWDSLIDILNEYHIKQKKYIAFYCVVFRIDEEGHIQIIPYVG